MVRAWVASTRSHAGSAVPSTTATVEFFVWPLPTAPEHGEDEGTGESSVAGGMREMSEEMERWIASLMSMLVQHPPADFVFRSRDALFVEVRVTDKETLSKLKAEFPQLDIPLDNADTASHKAHAGPRKKGVDPFSWGAIPASLPHVSPSSPSAAP